MPSPQIERLDATFGALVTEVDLAALQEPAWQAIESAFLEHALLVFPAQHLRPEAQVALARRFGEIEHVYGDRGFVPLANQRRDGTLLDDDEPAMQVMRGNEGWHTDSSYMPVSALGSILSAQAVPSSGGETEWADMRAAFAELDPSMRARVRELSAHHSIRYSQARIGHTGPDASGYGFAVGEPPLRPLVKTHPVTGVEALYIGRHAYDIPGLAPEASEQLLDELMAFACQPPRVYCHVWQPGDVAVWDNRCLLHRARPFDHREARVMIHTRIAGRTATEAGL